MSDRLVRCAPSPAFSSRLNSWSTWRWSRFRIAIASLLAPFDRFRGAVFFTVAVAARFTAVRPFAAFATRFDTAFEAFRFVFVATLREVRFTEVTFRLGDAITPGLPATATSETT